MRNHKDSQPEPNQRLALTLHHIAEMNRYNHQPRNQRNTTNTSDDRTAGMNTDPTTTTTMSTLLDLTSRAQLQQVHQRDHPPSLMEEYEQGQDILQERWRADINASPPTTRHRVQMPMLPSSLSSSSSRHRREQHHQFLSCVLNYALEIADEISLDLGWNDNEDDEDFNQDEAHQGF